jgi:phosphatidate cytidylyltransferase
VPEPTPSRKISGTIVRLLVAPLVLAAAVAGAWSQVATGSALGIDVLLLVLGGAAGFELARLLLPAGSAFETGLAALACAALGGVGILGGETEAGRHGARLAVVAGALLVLLAKAWRDVSPEAADRIARALVPLLYVGLLFSFVREVAAGEDGGRRLAWVILVSKASDIAGWLVGKPFGRHKLVPTVSPGKSWEGLAGGLAGSVLVAVFLAAPLGVPEASWSGAQRAVFGLALGGASVLAGITQSAWKRRAGAKDSSRLIPEMGGVLDMIDSLLLAGPLAWLWWR